MRKNANAISLVLMITITCVTQVLTLMKSSIVAGNFGTSVEMDAYNFANSLVSFLFGFIASGISTIVIPGYVHKDNRKGVDGFITCIYLVLALLSSLIILFRYQIVGLFHGRDEMFLITACEILLLFFFSSFLTSISNITSAYYQCIGHYNVPKILNLLSQIVVVVALLVFRHISIIQYAVIIAIGIVANFVIDLIIALKLGWRYKPNFDFKSKETIDLLKLFLPIIISTGIYRLSLLIDSVLATSLETGKLTILSYSSQIATMINSVLIGNLLIYIYPKLVAKIKETNNQKDFWNQTALFHMIVCLVISVFATVGQEGVALLFQHGSFDQNASRGVFIGALIYVVGQQTNIIRDLIYRYFYAKGDTKTASKNSIIVSVVNIVVSFILLNLIGFYGIMIGTIVASLVSLIRIWIQFGDSIGFEVSKKNTIRMFIKNIGIAIVTIFCVYLSKYCISIDSFLLSVLFFGIETCLIFISIQYLTNREILFVIKQL